MLWSVSYLELNVINGFILSIWMFARCVLASVAFAASEKIERTSFLTSFLNGFMCLMVGP